MIAAAFAFAAAALAVVGAGNLLAARAASIRLYASCSDSRSTSVQYAKSEENPSAR